MKDNINASTEEQIKSVTDALLNYGSSAIIALSGPPGTGKSHIASIAAQRITNEPLFVKEIQFHQSYSYEEFIEGLRIGDAGKTVISPGVFLDWNERALNDPKNTYVLLIEELTRGNLSAILGELLTFLEHRKRPFTTTYSRKHVLIANNIKILATYNPIDRTALDIDAAILRRLRILRFTPSITQLNEMLQGVLSKDVISNLQKVFEQCKSEFPDSFEEMMPFGHGIFAGVKNEIPDLKNLWHERIKYFLRRPFLPPHNFSECIEKHYKWRI